MNKVIVLGIPSGDLRINHEIKSKTNESEIIYETNIVSKTKNGKKNKVKVLINENSKHLDLFKNQNITVEVEGRFHSFNKDVEGHRISELYLKPETICESDKLRHLNKISLEGYIINEVLEKETYSGLVVETKLKVKRDGDSNKPFDYIPLVSFGDIAYEVAQLSKYDKVFIEGRIHSRDYLKDRNKKSTETTAYEVAVYKLNKIIA